MIPKLVTNSNLFIVHEQSYHCSAGFGFWQTSVQPVAPSEPRKTCEELVSDRVRITTCNFGECPVSRGRESYPSLDISRGELSCKWGREGNLYESSHNLVYVEELTKI